jgi:glyoxylase-like metal-dependent hydrolase (beta-lactamase superfamily II)
MAFNINIIRMSPANTNSVLIENGTDAVIFDPWGSSADWQKLLQERGLKLHAVYVTHGHYDHMSAIPKMNAPWHMHHADLSIIKWNNPILFMQGFGTIDTKKNPPMDIATGRHEILPGLVAQVIHTPGHSAGGVCFYFPDQKTLITGDTLFYDTVGRWDIPGASERVLRESVRALMNERFPDDTLVIPGHGRTGILSDIKKDNIFVKSWQ